MRYDYPRYKLSEDPLSLVVCQVRFSRIRKMRDYLPDIQDELRHNGFPNDASGIIQEVAISADSPQSARTRQIYRDEFRSKDEHWAAVVGEDQVALLTTAYDRYHGFEERLRMVLEVVDEAAHLSVGQVRRLGIRFVDVIAPGEGETYRDYLQPHLHGLQSDVFETEDPLVQIQSIGQTAVGTLNVRIWQNKQGAVFPPDLLREGSAMPSRIEVEEGSVLTLVDSDHAIAGAWDFDLETVLERTDVLHEAINRAWFRHIVTEHALRVWGARDATD